MAKVNPLSIQYLKASRLLAVQNGLTKWISLPAFVPIQLFVVGISIDGWALQTQPLREQHHSSTVTSKD